MGFGRRDWGNVEAMASVAAELDVRVVGDVDLQALLDRDPAELLRAYVALPPRHPSRESLRLAAIEAWLPLAQHLAARYAHRGEPVEDVRQVASVGLIKAVDRFDPQLGSDFVAFAVPTITGEIKRYFRDHTWDLRVPRRVKDLRADLATATEVLQHELRRVPTSAELAAYLELPEDEVREGARAVQEYRSLSLQTPLTMDDPTELGETLGVEETGYDLAEHRQALVAAVAGLDPRSRMIIKLRFFEDLTQLQIAERVGVSQMHVSRLITRALATLREALAVTA
jgi:RNA polymerase sigma-B factor